MANLPLSSQADSLDSLTVTREQFRLQQSDLLEFLAQALGNVSGDYTTQAVNPTGVVLQGTPTLAAGAEPTAVDDSLRLACTRWVRRHAVSAGTVAPLNPVRGQAWADTGSDPPAIKIWDDTPSPGSWVTLGLAPDATTTTKGLVQLADAAAIAAGTAGRVVDAAQLNAAGRVLKVQHYSNVGTSTNSTSFVNANSGTNFLYTPASSNSTLILLATFSAINDFVSAQNYSCTYRIGGPSIAYSSEYNHQVAAGSSGGAGTEMAAIQAAAANTSTAQRTFYMEHRTVNVVGAKVYTANIEFTVIEVAN